MTLNEMSEKEKNEMLEMYQSLLDSQVPEWIVKDKVNDVLFAEYYLKKHPMRCINKILYTDDGTLCNDTSIATDIMNEIGHYVSTNVPQRIANIIDTIKIKCLCDEPPLCCDRIHLNNGTLLLDGTFTTEKEFCLNRLPVNYLPNNPKPKKWLSFLSGLLEPEDILTLQEFMGYCLIPTNKGQKMLMILGNGGEGKSRIGLVLASMLGANMYSGSILSIEKDKYSRANLVGRLAMFDDDMALEALPDTHILKTLITLEGSTDVEIKHKQSYQARIYTRFIAVGNGALSSLHDRSDGFYRRQIVLMAKPKDPKRIDDAFLSEKLAAEIDGIFLWCFEGLKRIIRNDYKFTISEKAQIQMEEVIEDSNNIISFLNSKGYIMLEPNTKATTAQIYETYIAFCRDNCLKPMSEKTVSGFLKTNSNKYGLQYSQNIDTGKSGKKARGYIGIHTQIRTEH